MKHTKSQFGRSMVEMLGVLAVIGVLSIGGIMGYSYAMDKYRANETINGIQLRAVDLIAQANSGHIDLSFAEWENTRTMYDFSNPNYTEDGLVVFDVGILNPLPKRVCEIVYDSLSGMSAQIDINTVPATSKDSCGDNNEMTFYFFNDNSKNTDELIQCGEGEYNDNGICFKLGNPEVTKPLGDCDEGCGQCSSCINSVCHPDVQDNKVCLLENGINGLCKKGVCYPQGCTTNSDCKEPGTYCASQNSSCTERFQGEEKGACVPIDFIRKEINGEVYYISNTYISYWDGEYACEAIGKNMGRTLRLLSVNDLITEADGSSWKNDEGYHIRTELAEELYDHIGYAWIETSNPIDTCNISMVYVFDGYVNITTRRNISGGLIVCH